MKISFNWLKDHVPVDMDVNDVARILTDTGLEVEGVSDYESIRGALDGVVVGKVLHAEHHPDADRLKLTKVDVGQGVILDIVCGAPNVAEGQKVAVATVGATLYPSEGEPFTIKKSKIRGALSEGMLCAEDELGLGESHDGIMVLDAGLDTGIALSEVMEVYRDKVIEIGLTPNRMDAISHRGVARDLVAYLSLGEAISLTHQENEIPKASGGRIKVTVLDTDGCRRYSGIEMEGIQVGPSPDWLANRLKAIGLKPINNVVDITNYVMHDLGQPLHAFDLDKIKGGRIHVRRALKGEPFVTLDEVRRELSDEDLMICDEKDPMCIAGVFGGALSGVSSGTKRIFLESAAFDPVSIRKSAKRHLLNTDSSFRFERGVDPNGTLKALAKAVSLLQEVCGAKVASDLTDIDPEPLKPLQLALDLERTATLIGVSIVKERMIKILEALDFVIKERTESAWQLEVPTYRMDVTRQADVVEELLRIHGFNQVPLPGKISHSIANRNFGVDESFRSTMSRYLTGRGFTEVMNNSLSAKRSQELLTEIEASEAVVMLNPLSQDLSVLRQRMLWGALDSVAYNVNRQKPDMAFFEFGNTHFKKEGAYGQKSCLALTITGSRYRENWDRPRDKASFYDLKALVDTLINKVKGSRQLEISSMSSELYSEGLSFSVNGKELAHIGVVQKKVAKQFEVKQEVFHAELDWSLMKEMKDKNTFKLQEIAKFPAVRRDLSLLLDQGLKFHDLQTLALKSGGKLLKEVLLFDVYEGDKLPPGKVSYALGFVIQDEQFTLTDKAVEKVMARIQKSLEDEFKAELRQ
ncbi:MAG: phenylalanine--tRNA ligase subunit beta [Bacteroidetes bacterium]|nr:phenylalanine--tRNA ligase subunit beta [Bacteroidota bacterium]